MTKHRAPLSFEQAIQRIAGQIPGGIDEMASIADRQPRTIRNWTDPDTPESIPLDVALRLDLAFQAAGGVGAPLWEAYTHHLEMAEVDAFATRHCLGRLAAETILEAGEATAALVLSSQPGSTPADVRNAQREVAEAIAKLQQALPALDAALHETRPHPPP